MSATVCTRIPRIDQMVPPRLDVATFGMGSFLGSEPWFGVTKGIWKTTVGYAGGKYDTPSYDDTGDHFEVVMVEYDPLMISYGQLLELFLLCRSPQRNLLSPRRSSCILVANETERRLAQAAHERYELCMGSSALTQIAFRKNFHRAENWCQKYFLRTAAWLMRELERFFPNEESFIRSTLTMRLNGLLGRKSPSRFLPEDIEFYDLDAHIVYALKRIML